MRGDGPFADEAGRGSWERMRGIITPVLEPVLSHRIMLPEDADPREILPKLRQLEDEDPALRITWDEQLREIHAKIMGEVQTEILQSLIKDRFGIDVSLRCGQDNL